ncbi:hypothetical protein V7793_03605 [Streptomyces sp. KLMMK]|uniref:hypothetical protein n=1 Tax=Streptomyces sp. KLMMK TaxID=3109353 RepID=UPI002FFDBD55
MFTWPLVAKFVGRWRSGAPLALAPDHDDPELGADPMRNNDFRYQEDPRGQGHHQDLAVAAVFDDLLDAAQD